MPEAYVTVDGVRVPDPICYDLVAGYVEATFMGHPMLDLKCEIIRAPIAGWFEHQWPDRIRYYGKVEYHEPRLTREEAMRRLDEIDARYMGALDELEKMLPTDEKTDA